LSSTSRTSTPLTCSGQIAVTATHCAKTLVAAAAAGNVALQHCVKYLIPGVVLYVTTVAGRNRGDGGAQSDAESDVQGVEEALKAFSVLFSSFPEASRASMVVMNLCVYSFIFRASSPWDIFTRSCRALKPGVGSHADSYLGSYTSPWVCD
jgi:hypothetical protein